MYSITAMWLRACQTSLHVFKRLVSLQGRVVATKCNNILWLWVIRSVCFVFLGLEMENTVPFHCLFQLVVWHYNELFFCSSTVCVPWPTIVGKCTVLWIFATVNVFTIVKQKKKLSLNPFGIESTILWLSLVMASKIWDAVRDWPEGSFTDTWGGVTSCVISGSESDSMTMSLVGLEVSWVLVLFKGLSAFSPG